MAKLSVEEAAAKGMRADLPLSLPPLLPPSITYHDPMPSTLLRHSREGEWGQQRQQGYVCRAQLRKSRHDGLPEVPGVEGSCRVGDALLLSGKEVERRRGWREGIKNERKEGVMNSPKLYVHSHFICLPLPSFVQACFKANWPEHKKVHKAPSADAGHSEEHKQTPLDKYVLAACPVLPPFPSPFSSSSLPSPSLLSYHALSTPPEEVLHPSMNPLTPPSLSAAPPPHLSPAFSPPNSAPTSSRALSVPTARPPK